MTERFTVELDGCGAWYIKDNDAKQYNMPEKAVTIFFKDRIDCSIVADKLNKEWSRFLSNPS